jgi:hypothetical protein
MLANMAVNLWNLSQRHSPVDPKVMVNTWFQIYLYFVFKFFNYFVNLFQMRTKAYMMQKSHHREYEHFADILRKMSRWIISTKIFRDNCQSGYVHALP